MKHLKVPKGGALNKPALAQLLKDNIRKEVVTEDANIGSLQLQASVLQKWHMKPIKGGENMQALKEGLSNEAHVLRMLPAFFQAADQTMCQVRYEISKIISVGKTKNIKCSERNSHSYKNCTLLFVT